MTLKMRLLSSAAVLAVGGFARTVLLPASTIGSAVLAGHQFDNSNAAAVVTDTGLSYISGAGGVVSLVSAAALLSIWWKPLRRAILAGLGVTALASLTVPNTAWAFYSTTDVAEAVTIMPNESAFWIPDTGANKDTQTNLDSESYLAANKIAVKRFVIPHAIFRDSGGRNWFKSDFYVPTGRMIIVDRAPYNREWVKANDRGTASKDESFPCQTRDGLNITAEVSVAASVSEENSPKFLHYFGVNNPVGDRSAPEVIFTSVYYGRSLTQVMDGIGRGLVQTAVCHEIGERTFDQANNDYNAVMDAVRAQTVKFLGDRGITVDYIGWAGTWTFDKDVQQAVNDRYTGEHIVPVLPTLQAKAVVDALEGWNHQLPQSVSLSSWGGFGDLLNSILGGAKK